MENFKKLAFLLVSIFIFNSVAWAQNDSVQVENGYHFTDLIELPYTPVKDQNRSGTCWSFSTIAFLESEMLRMGKPATDLSEMYIVWHTYMEKAVKYVRLHGNINFAAGGAFHDVTQMIKEYGIVPESVYDGLNYGEEKHVHAELDRMLLEQVKSVVENGNKKLSSAWTESIKGTLNAYLGELPDEFNYAEPEKQLAFKQAPENKKKEFVVEGKTYTPQSFAKDYVGLNMDDYVELSSFTHHPFYDKFVIEIPDNWMWGEVYNLPLDEFMEVIDNAINTGYTVAWGADVSEKGFSTSRQGVAVVPDVDKAEMSDAEIAKWESLSDKEKSAELYKLDKPGKEKEITQLMRQVGFDDYETTDDHGMLIVGTAKDQDGNLYYKVKNSWGDYNKYDGLFYASKPYVEYKTISIMVHKDAIPKAIREKLNL
ncbi:C1 family peptidase [Mangrovibacterium diazotrophicum]|uniref:Aminopeptidase n=1 Tax=Mangrovibacterium diazotrophicum TaxID=1261403 RepID=A0A419VWV6_9BACT|nr:C1 family peptidase [Mangrovibacterium diazotrophicum]RKD86482.1 bleomycin hydrolase [Mangrovibacterium diazotrophicum]